MEQTVAPRRFRAIFISDLHLGTKRARCDLILDFLRDTESHYLYLVGDLIDSWSLKKHWYWDQKQNDVIQKLLRKARKGTRVIYLPGNHDENFREFCGHRFGRVAILNETVHTTANGKRYLVLHGDKFDSVVYFAAWLAKLGDWAYERSDGPQCGSPLLPQALWPGPLVTVGLSQIQGEKGGRIHLAL